MESPLPTRAITRCWQRVYSHGGFYGAGPELLRRAVWRECLLTLTPHAAARISASTRPSPSSLMRALENNPCMAAFGVALEYQAAPLPAEAPAASLSHAPVVIEWDVHLSPSALLAARRAAHGEAATRAHAARALAQSCLVCHGGVWDTVKERLLGISSYPAIAARSGGMTTVQWLRCYLQALAAGAPGVNVGLAARGGGAGPPPMLSVFLDVKTSAARGEELAMLVEGLNEAGVHVYGVGSFIFTQLLVLSQTQVAQRVVVPRGSSGAAEASAAALAHVESWAASGASPSWSADVTTLSLPPPLALHLLSHVAELQTAPPPQGAAILYNGGSMLELGGGGYGVPPRLLRELEALRAQRGWALGFYAQEPMLCPDAADSLARLANESPTTFALGWGFGGLPGQTEEGVEHGCGFGEPPWWAAWCMPRRAWKMAPGS